MTAHEAFEEIGRMVDTLDNGLAALNLPVDPQIHIKGLSGIMRDIRDRLRQIVIEQTGENPWE